MQEKAKEELNREAKHWQKQVDRRSSFDNL